MKDKLQKLNQEALNQLNKIKDIKAFYNLETKYLGRKGKLTKMLRNLAVLSEKERRNVGQTANAVKNELLARFKEVKNIIQDKGRVDSSIDVTLPGKKIKQGHLHPITQIRYELEDLFTSMGFMALDGPELESDYYNFEALNIPHHHPARDIQDTFYIEQKNKKGEYDLLMRTHTSPMQVRAMQKYGAPLKCVVPGRVFRHEATDACHETTFYQLEGLMIDKDITFTNLISVMQEMLVNIFSKDIKTRVRPGYFPFVEPGLEVDMSCTICGGQGCPGCKNSGWLEMAGSGMVHPKVLQHGGIDPKQYSGFAFGFGLNRLVMMRYGIDDIRLFNSGDLRFLEQF